MTLTAAPLPVSTASSPPISLWLNWTRPQHTLGPLHGEGRRGSEGRVPQRQRPRTPEPPTSRAPAGTQHRAVLPPRRAQAWLPFLAQAGGSRGVWLGGRGRQAQFRGAGQATRRRSCGPFLRVSGPGELGPWQARQAARSPSVLHAGGPGCQEAGPLRGWVAWGWPLALSGPCSLHLDHKGPELSTASDFLAQTLSVSGPRGKPCLFDRPGAWPERGHPVCKARAPPATATLRVSPVRPGAQSSLRFPVCKVEIMRGVTPRVGGRCANECSRILRREQGSPGAGDREAA